MADSQQMTESAKLRMRLQMHSRFRLEVLAALSRVFREFQEPVSDDLLSALILAVPDELVGEAHHRPHSPVGDNKPPPGDFKPPPSPGDNKPSPPKGGHKPPKGGYKPPGDNKPPPGDNKPLPSPLGKIPQRRPSRPR